MIRVSVPIDVRAVVETDSPAFALATPLRVDDLLALAVNASLGPRAPQDKRARALRATLGGLREGKFVVDVDGRTYERAEDVVVCAGFVTLRFFIERELRAPR